MSADLSQLNGRDVSPSTLMIHEGHPKQWIAVSKTMPRLRLWCCDNCGRHHWGEWNGGYWSSADYIDADFAYSRPDGSPYLCKAGHVLHGGPEYCTGECGRCWGARQALISEGAANAGRT